MKQIPKFEGRNIEEKIENMRAYFERKFIDEYEGWAPIVAQMNNHIREYISDYGFEPDAVEPFTYNEFCARYISYIAQFMELEGDYKVENTNAIVQCMTVERLPENITQIIMARGELPKHKKMRLEREKLQEETGIHASPRRAKRSAKAENEQTEYIPEIWRVGLGATESIDLLPPAPDEDDNHPL